MEINAQPPHVAATHLGLRTLPFSSFLHLAFPHTPFLPLSVWFINCSVSPWSHSRTPRPAALSVALCCRRLSTTPFSPASAPPPSPGTSTLEGVGRRHLSCRRDVHPCEFPSLRATPPARLPERPVGVARRGLGSACTHGDKLLPGVSACA